MHACSKFGYILSSGLGDSVTDRQMDDGHTERWLTWNVKAYFSLKKEKKKFKVSPAVAAIHADHCFLNQ